MPSGASSGSTLAVAWRGRSAHDARSPARPMPPRRTGAGRPSAASVTDVVPPADRRDGGTRRRCRRRLLAVATATAGADADALSAASSRRAAAESSSTCRLVIAPSRRASARPDAGDDRDQRPPVTCRRRCHVVTIGSFGTSGGAPDAGPSITQLAVLAAALLGVLWLSRRLLASELSWQSTFLTLSIERPG